MKYYLNHKEVTAEEFERSRVNGFANVTQYSAEFEEGERIEYSESSLTVKEIITLSLIGAFVAVCAVKAWQYFATIPL